MIDVFIATLGKRTRMLERVRDWWAPLVRERKVRVSIIRIPRDLEPVGFDRWRRMIAERRTRTAVYVLSDDDILPVGEPGPWLALAVRTMAEHPEFGLLAAWLDNEPLSDRAAVCAHVVQEGDVGGLRLIRHGLVTSWPESEHPRGAYDSDHCRLIKAAGSKVGYARELHALHLGKGASEIWANWPNRPGDR